MTDNRRYNSNFSVIENADHKIEMLCTMRAKVIHGGSLPAVIEDRLSKELSIIKENVGASAYLIAHKLVKKSNEAGYLVASRGAVGSSLVAYLLGITEVDPIKYDLPFEVFLGLNGEKRPDFGLNFALEQKEEIVKYLTSLFGEGRVACGGATLVCRATGDIYYGAHPGKYFIVPDGKKIEDFASLISVSEESHTLSVTQVHSYVLEDRLLHVDIFSHDGLTIIRKLEIITGISAKVILLDDEKTLSLLKSADTDGVPGFDTEFVRYIIKEAKPERFDDFAKIIGLSHNSNMWLDNAEMLIKHGVASLQEVIAHRDEVMMYLMGKGISREEAYEIMERVWRERGLLPEEEALMSSVGVPDWYTNSCKKIGYLFPKTHSLQYTMMAFRIAWYKAHYPDVFERVMKEMNA